MERDWIIQPPSKDAAQSAVQWNVPPLVAQLLLNRNVSSLADARAFLQPKLADMHPPETLPGATAAADLICDTLRRGEKIVLYGDYDVDGITGVAILWHVLTIAGADVSFYVPDRIEEGYGLNEAAVESLADDGARLIVTVDCGITAVRQAETAKRLGVKLIVTDHHTPRTDLPQADGIVHPTVGGSYANPHLCGAGVAFKLAWAIAQRLSGAATVSPEYRAFLLNALPLAAMGTIADIVPLLGENRVIARGGLARIRDCSLPGMRALLDVAGLNDGTVDGTDVGFKLAPRINAAGRMGHARLAVEMLTRADDDRAREIAVYLQEWNGARQAKERQGVKLAIEMIENAGLDGDANRAIVLATDEWHPGVIGIVAARIVDRYHKPTVLIALREGVGQGSARSVEHFDMHRAFEECAQHLVDYGGHTMAGGLRVNADAIDAFTEAFVGHANNSLSGTAIRGRLQIDAEARFADLDERCVLAIGNLGPFGNGNAKPLLATGWVELDGEPRCVGKKGDHVQLSLRDDGAVIRGIAFRAADRVEELKEHRWCRVAFCPAINDFAGRRRVEIEVVDFKFPHRGDRPVS